MRTVSARERSTVLRWFLANPGKTATDCARAMGHKSWALTVKELHARCELVPAPSLGRGNCLVVARHVAEKLPTTEHLSDNRTGHT